MRNLILATLLLGTIAYGVSKKVINSDVKITGGTASTSSTTGALVVSGGVGVSNSVRVGTNAGTGGAIGVPNNTGNGITFRNAANSDNLEQYLDASNRMVHPAQNLGPIGTSGAPTWSSFFDTDSGLNLLGGNAVEIAVGGSANLLVSPTQVAISNVQLRVPDGTSGAPSYSFNTDTDTGDYLISSNRMGTALGGLASVNLLHGSYQFRKDATSAAGVASIGITNNNTGSTSDAALNAIVASTAAGDPYLYQAVPGGAERSIGIDNSDSDTFKITTGGSGPSSGTTHFSISTAGLNTIGASGGTQAHVVNGTTVINTGSTDTQGLSVRSSNTTGVARMNVSNSDFTRYFHIIGDFSSGTENLSISSDNTTIFNTTRAGLSTFNQTLIVNGQLIGKGTATNDSPAAGFIGEVLQCTGTTVSLAASGNYGDVCSSPVSLTAGDWMCNALLHFETNGASVTSSNFGIGTAAGNSAAGVTQGVTGTYFGTSLGGNDGAAIPSVRVSLSGTTSYYLKIRASYTVATPQASGRVTCQRIR